MEREEQKANKLIFLWVVEYVWLIIRVCIFPFCLSNFWGEFLSWFWMLPWITVNHKCLRLFFALPVLILRCCQLQGQRHWVGVGFSQPSFLTLFTFLVTLLQYQLLGESGDKFKYNSHELNPFSFIASAIREKFIKSACHIGKKKAKKKKAAWLLSKKPRFYRINLLYVPWSLEQQCQVSPCYLAISQTWSLAWEVTRSLICCDVYSPHLRKE